MALSAKVRAAGLLLGCILGSWLSTEQYKLQAPADGNAGANKVDIAGILRVSTPFPPITA